MKRDKRLWVRKYITSDGEPADGITRIRTALRVARTVQEKEKADIVQVAMLDKAGPTDRAQMRGRMIGAQVVYIPDLAKAPEGADAQIYSAYYIDGNAAANGEYYGMRIDLPLEDVEGLTAKLTDKADCADPIVVIDPNAAVDPTKPKTHGKMEGKKEHGEAEGKGHGEEASGHGETPAAEGEGHGAAPAEGHGEEVASKESGGFLSSITGPLSGMIFGAKEEAPAAAHGSEGASHAAPATSHDAPGASHGEPAAADAHGEQKPASGHDAPASADAHADPKAAPAGAVLEGHADAKDEAPAKNGDHGDKAVEAAPDTSEGGIFSSVKNMIFGGGDAAKSAAPDDKEKAAADGKDKAFSLKDVEHATANAAAPAPVADVAAKGHGDKPADAVAHGPTAADNAGASFLARMRGQPAPADQPAGTGKPVQAATSEHASPAAVTH
jgi:hypothetical protein